MNVPRRPVISNYGIPTERSVLFLDHYLKKGHAKRMVIVGLNTSGLECAKGSFRKKVKETIPMEKH